MESHTQTDKNSDTHLHHANEGDCNKKPLQAIVDKGADVNVTNSENQSALVLASLKGNIGAINVLLNAEADPNIADDDDGNTCLHCAASGECRKEVLQAIIDQCVNVNAPTKSKKR